MSSSFHIKEAGTVSGPGWRGEGGFEVPITIMEEVPRRLYHLRINTPNFKHKFVWFNLTADMLSYFKWVAGFQRF